MSKGVMASRALKRPSLRPFHPGREQTIIGLGVELRIAARQVEALVGPPTRAKDREPTPVSSCAAVCATRSRMRLSRSRTPSTRRSAERRRSAGRGHGSALMSSIESRVIAVIVRQLRVEEKAVTPDASIADDLRADSLHTVELIMALESEFGLQIPDEDVEEFTTVRQAVDYIVRATHGE